MSAPIEEEQVEAQIAAEEDKQVLESGAGPTNAKADAIVPEDSEKQVASDEGASTPATAQLKKSHNKDKPPVTFEGFGDSVARQEDQTKAKVARSKSAKAYKRLSGLGDIWSRNRSQGEANEQKSGRSAQFVSTPQYKEVDTTKPLTTDNTKKGTPVGRALSLKLPSKTSRQLPAGQDDGKKSENAAASKPANGARQKIKPGGSLGRALSLHTVYRRGIEYPKPANRDKATTTAAVPTIIEETGPKEAQQETTGLGRAKSTLLRRHGAKSGPSVQPTSTEVADGMAAQKEITDAQEKPSSKWKFWKK